MMFGHVPFIGIGSMSRLAFSRGARAREGSARDLTPFFVIARNCRSVVDDKRRIELNSLLHIVKRCRKVPS